MRREVLPGRRRADATRARSPRPTRARALQPRNLRKARHQRSNHLHSLQHAPVNEQGVVFLFGTVAHDLGFVIERRQTGHHDCEAKQHVKGGRGYERVRIEFKFRSSNFNHQPEGCDLIACWEHTAQSARSRCLTTATIASGVLSVAFWRKGDTPDGCGSLRAGWSRALAIDKCDGDT